MEHDAKKAAALKERAKEELKLYLILTLYLWVALGSFTVYRRLILAEAETSYLHYGIALIEALIIAKVILIGRLFGFSRRFEDQPLIVPVLYKSLVFGILVLVFGILEHFIEGWVHKQGAGGAIRAARELGADELLARVLMMIVAFIPCFAFGEVGRVIGADKLRGMFFAKRDPSGDAQRPAS